MPANNMSEKALVSRIRGYILVMVLSVALQGAFLANAMGSARQLDWIIWAVVLAVAVVFIALACVRVIPLSREYRRRKWGDAG